MGGERPVPNGHALRDGPPRCPRHVNDPDPPPCGQCAEARRTAERTAADGVLAELAARSAFRAAVDACDRCDEFGMREIGDAVARCDHTAAEVS